MAVVVLLALLLLPDYPKSSGALPDIDNQAFITDCVTVHNQLRSQVNPPASDMLYMTWDEALAKTAKAWARTCQFSHNIYLKQAGKVHPTFTPVGENIWVGAPSSTFSVSAAIEKWYDEVKDYRYNDRSCSRVCGHYTQVVWAKSYKVGCAVHICPSGITGFNTNSIPDPTIFVCNYGDAGNFPTHPYSSGPECRNCPGETCENKLCKKQTRDQSIGYADWNPDFGSGSGSDAASASCNSYFLAVVITRPLALVLIIAGVYGLQLVYPHVFAYE
ncbi:GLIPR1-like protein 1 [Acipenser ruthenus]|uniref:GLIPR1-like protein 1 n=1 Tax=Acipenser ruthenus TaxID=7906 RepID=UPI00145A887D|nr:GLIPR1-like protein 1 [Acipenser ruthenus]